MKVALLTIDNREPFREHHKTAPWFGTAPAALLQGFAALPEVEVHVISCIRQPVQSPEKIAPNIFFHSLVVPKIGWMRTLYQGCIRATRKQLREIQPDLVHGQGTELDCGMSASFSGFPNVLTIHGNMKAIAEIYRARFASFHWMAARLETIALKRTGGVFCNSGYTEKLVAPRARRTWRVPNALQSEFFAPLPEKPATTSPVILNVGVIEPRKQQVELLEVARKLHQRGLKFQLQFIGDRGAQTGYGKRFTHELAAAEKAGYGRHLGRVDTRQLVAAMDAAVALIHFPTEEAFGLVVAEALARNLKLFGATTGGMVDIANGVDGAELFPADNFAGLESALARWLNAGGPLPRTAAATMRQRYHPEVVARRHLEIYQEVLQKS
jgi:glycosyltransferase involved in cell wall biosynthesis